MSNKIFKNSSKMNHFSTKIQNLPENNLSCNDTDHVSLVAVHFLSFFLSMRNFRMFFD